MPVKDHKRYRDRKRARGDTGEDGNNWSLSPKGTGFPLHAQGTFLKIFRAPFEDAVEKPIHAGNGYHARALIELDYFAVHCIVIATGLPAGPGDGSSPGATHPKNNQVWQKSQKGHPCRFACGPLPGCTGRGSPANPRPDCNLLVVVKVWVMPSIQPGLHQLARHVGKAWKLKTSSKVGAKTENCARKAKKAREKLKVAREN
ncbi:hypothetical protein C8F04DRAFT_1198743 [Mycena alexandri]|uniref:Uncharacterized protein n=1 Tax=Mycena alexandri TaxID=1745969 RepID=A0AAD6WRT7_9AGAR|nr:hypothetical protein C8F04DRAFT_1198743 [Mycena alexandri]